jgi:hypothetical protein
MKRLLHVSLPDERTLQHFPESSVLCVLDAALGAAELTLLTEHPCAIDLPLDPEHDIAPSLLTAHLILSRARELRHLLDLYSAACHRALAWDDDADDDAVGYESLF